MHSEAENDELVMTLMEGALARPPAERDEYLRHGCGSDTALYEEVASRVSWEERMGGFLRDSIIPPPFDGFPPGELVAGRFRIIRELGRGGMGQVCEAFDEKLSRRVAVKSASRGFQARLSPEARAALEVSHPNVCKIHEIHSAGTPHGTVDFLTMEFVDGPTAAERLTREGSLPEREVRQIALQLCSGLAQAHRQGVIHGDIKTGNVILSRTADGLPRAVLTDFGLARIAQTAAGTAAEGGTPAYMAPELTRGAAPGIASDLYAFGVLLHVLLTGTTPESASPLKLPGKRWARIVSRCLAPNAVDRFASADAIAAILSARAAVAKWLLAAAVLVIAVLGAALWLNRAGDPGPPVRLAVLPFTIEDSALSPAAGIAAEVAERLHGLRANFVVIPPDDAARQQVDSADKARSALRATHVLSTRLRRSGSGIAAEARLIDAASGQALRQLRGEYSRDDTATLAKALIGTVTRNFGLRANAAREAVSQEAYPHYARGVELLRREARTAADAIPHFRKAIELDRRSALPRARLAQAQIQVFRLSGSSKHLMEAGASIEQARGMNPDSVPVLLASGAYLQMHGKYEQAAEEFARATQLEPSDAEAWRGLAVSYERSGRDADAVAAYRKGIDAQPDNYPIHASLGGYYLARNEFRQAEDVFRRAVAAAPSVAAAHMNLGVTLLMQAKFAEAEESLVTSLRLRRTSPVLMNLGTLNYNQERFSEARRWYEEALRESPGAIQYRAFGDACRRLGDKAGAKRAYRTGAGIAEAELLRNPRQADTRGLLGLMYAHLGERQRAASELSQALALEPDNALVMRDAVIGWETLRRRDRVFEVLRRVPPFLLTELSRNVELRDLQKNSDFQAIIKGSSAR
jgi:serine/threonine protein kinase/Flp pilus assembly protein TadD